MYLVVLTGYIPLSPLSVSPHIWCYQQSALLSEMSVLCTAHSVNGLHGYANEENNIGHLVICLV